MERLRSLFLLFLLLLLPLSTLPLPAADEPDPRVSWLQEHAVELSTLDPAATGFDDLEPLKEILAGARVVMLGEATRGDGSAFLAKGRLIRFLHREMGFDVLALECGFYACARSWREIRAGADPRQALDHGLLTLYTESDQFQPVIELLAERRGADRPLVVAGYDSQLAGPGSGPMDDLGEVLKRLGEDPEAISGFREAAAIVGHLARESYAMGQEPLPGKDARERFTRTLEEIGRRLDGRGAASGGGEAAGAPLPEGESAFWLQVLDNLDAEARAAWELGVYRPARGMPAEIISLRNRQMAENLLWLAKTRYPGKKLLVWSLTVQLARDLGRLETGDRELKARLERFVTIGDVLDDALGDEVYTVGFTAFQGRKGSTFQTPHSLLDPTPGSFEELMGRTGLEAAFVDLRSVSKTGRRGRWLARPLIARPLSYAEVRGRWPRHLDGFVFLRTLEPSRRAR